MLPFGPETVRLGTRKASPRTLFEKIQERFRSRFARLHLAEREVLRRICRLVCERGNVGSFSLDPKIDGDSPLATCVARSLYVEDAEAIARAMETLCRFELIAVTSDFRIVLPVVFRDRAHSSAINGCLSIGRRRKGESLKRYRARARAHRSNVMRSDVQEEVVNDLERLSATFVSGEALAHVLRSRPSGLPNDPNNVFERFEQTVLNGSRPSTRVSTSEEAKPDVVTDVLPDGGSKLKRDAHLEEEPRKVECALSPELAEALQKYDRARKEDAERSRAKAQPRANSHSLAPKLSPTGPTARKLLETSDLSSQYPVEISTVINSIIKKVR